MKKLLILFMTVLLALPGFSQFSVGPRLGVNFAKITGKYNKDDDSKGGWITGLEFGAVGNYEFSDMISLTAELLFITDGDKTSFNVSDGEKSTLSSEYDYKFSERYHYMQLPVLVKFVFGSDFQFYGNLGPYFGYKIGGHYKTNFDNNTTKGRIRFKKDKVKDDDWYQDPKDYRRFDLGMYLGGGVQKQVGPGKLGADLRFGMGFLDTNKFDSKDDKQNAKDNGYKSFRNMNISLTLTYMYDLSK
ncbi:MAG TPA: PorT family protein [Bacteroidetes bacterium]|nr:PorT family protein [Bacteroidota bacterium]